MIYLGKNIPRNKSKAAQFGVAAGSDSHLPKGLFVLGKFRFKVCGFRGLVSSAESWSIVERLLKQSPVTMHRLF
jgi:hypothetical protein